VQKDFEAESVYRQGFSVATLFSVHGVGMTTAHDNFVIDDSKRVLLERYTDFKNSPPDAELLHSKFDVRKKKGWNILNGWQNLQHEDDLTRFIKVVSYRPFDNRFVFYENKLVWRTVNKVMQHFLKGGNVGLVTARSNKSETCDHFFISENIMETKCGERTTQSAIFPLYLYPEGEANDMFAEKDRKPNLDTDIVKQIAKSLKLTFVPEKENRGKNTFAPMDILDYIYAVLHSPTYRERYKEFLKTDFPRVPYPRDKKTFRKLVRIGGELRTIHLLENPRVDQFVTTYPQDGDNIISRRIVKKDFEITDRKNKIGRIWINDRQCFDKIPVTAWEFYIGGYQPAQKWLKDRKGRELSFDDILHYQKIIVALNETGKLMKKADMIDFV